VPLNLSIFNRAIKSLQSGDKRIFTSLSGSSGALLFAMAESPCLIICPSEETASEFHSDTLFWSKATGTEEPLLIPSKDSPDRLKGLSDLYRIKSRKVIASVEASVSPLWSIDEFPLILLSTGADISRDSIISRLQVQGYLSVTVVSAEGEMSIKGGILDIFPPDSEYPVRIEFFGDSIESLRFFDPDTQLSIREIEAIKICPAEEPEEGPDLIQLLAEEPMILNEPDEIKRRYTEQEALLSGRNYTVFTAISLMDNGLSLNIDGTGDFAPIRNGLKKLQDNIKKIILLSNDHFILLVCSSEWQAKRLRELFSETGLSVPISNCSDAINKGSGPVITTGELSRGFRYNNTIVLAERDIFGRRPAYRPIKRSRVSHLISSFEDLKQGDHLVHIDHGIGRFMGTKKERIEGYEGEFMTIEYLGGDRIYVPLERINCVQKYNAPDQASPRMDKLGGKTWLKRRNRVKEKIKVMAKKLVKLYAKRSTAKGHAFSLDTEMHHEFDDFFPYDETPDQLNAVSEIKKEMESAVPLDRLLCGDVGYGKTEVAIRACFKAVYDSRQVAVLVPTTILAEQHYRTFLDRFSAFPVNIDIISRFKTGSEQKKTIKALSNGDTDIIIGTHRLLGKDVGFYNLGLLIIDEEHKFGVTHKEKIKALKTDVDILSLTATPIPRTLHMALSGIRSMSVIETPPEERLAVKSSVAGFSPQIIKNALQKELLRDGQAFFINNRIHNIHEIAESIRKLVPEGKIAVAHGRMKGGELDRVMHSFYTKKSNILVSTAIISSGLDIPTANTIIINRADKFGLADLYQLRGRVGRSNIKAYAYFLIPGEDIITEKAKEKVMAIQELSYLGAGFRLALKDLEIRGAGNLLGPEQSGHIEAVGYDLYIKMLHEAVAGLKGEDAGPGIEPVLELHTTAVIPEEYIKDPSLRLNIYRRISSRSSIEEIGMLRDELNDRFGSPPEETGRLLDIMELKITAKRSAVTVIKNIGGRFRVILAPGTTVDSHTLSGLHKNDIKLKIKDQKSKL
jgi:transcription-repair coupling factor (superfamily II helicase)